LKNTRIVEHPIIHVVFTRDEHIYMEEQDLIVFEAEKDTLKDGMDDPSATDTPTLGDVLSQTDAMQADPDAYKQYFDFYLKYYTSKYAQQGVNPEQTSQAHTNPYAGLAQNIASNTYPQRSQLSNNTFPKRTQNPSNTTGESKPNLTNKGQQYPNLNTHIKTQNQNPTFVFSHNQKYPNRSHYQGEPSTDCHSYQQNDHRMSDQNTKREEVNRSNIKSARKIQEDLKANKSANLLGGLVAYDDSDSDSD